MKLKCRPEWITRLIKKNMNTQQTVTKKQSVEKAYISHLLRYVGVGLISGSIVHVGTLGGGYTRYVILIIMGVIAFIAGTLLEKKESESSLTVFILISVIMSIGVGMVSGGTQHYLDGPVFAAFLIPIGIAVGYFAFLVRDHRSEITLKRIGAVLSIAAVLCGGLYYLAHTIPSMGDHHQAAEADTGIITSDSSHRH